jgi:hypothetical protein
MSYDYDDFDEGNLHVFVPAIMSVGVLFSLITLLRDLFRRGEQQELRRYGSFAGPAVAGQVLRGWTTTEPGTTHLRSRWRYALVGAFEMGMGFYALYGGTVNYFGRGFAHGQAWLFALALATWVALVPMGATLVLAAVSWENPPAWTRSLLLAVSVGARKPNHDRGGGGPPNEPRPPRLGVWRISDRLARRMRLVARLWVAGAVVAFAALSVTVGVPSSPERGSAGAWLELVQLALLAIIGIAFLLGIRWHKTGLILAALGSVSLGALAAMEYIPWIAMGVALTFMVPTIVHWVSWQRKETVGSILVLAVMTITMLLGGAVGASRLYDHYYGPTHPVSTTAPLPPSPVDWVWSGGVTVDGARVVARIATGSDVRLAVGGNPDLSDARFLEGGTLDATRMMSFDIDGLRPDSVYHYALEVDGEIDLVRAGRFRTFPVGPASFSIAMGACARTGSNGSVFDTIRELDPLLFMALGDFHYGNVDVASIPRFQAPLFSALRSGPQSALYRSVPIAYLWDDHDFGPNDGDRTSPTRDVALTVYGRSVPHYPLVEDRGLAQAFTVGRVRVIMTDTRSQRDPSLMPDDPEKSMLGAVQKQWFEDELLAARDTHALILWANPDPWIAAPMAGLDSWGGYATERAELSNFIAENDIRNLVMVSGDAHMVAIDDGTNSDYSDTGEAGFPILHAGALDRPGSVKGGPYSEGTFPGGGQFGVLEVTDHGGSRIEVTITGMNWAGEELVTHSFSRRVAPGI